MEAIGVRMSSEPADPTDRQRSRDHSEVNSAAARLVYMYLERVPAAYTDEISRDLQLSEQVLTPVLDALAERGVVRERESLYVLSNEETS